MIGLITKGSWVEIVTTVLEVGDRAINIPEETKKTPLKMWAKGFALENCNVGDEIEIETIVGRKIIGVVTELNPKYSHDFGDFIPELLYIGKQAKEILRKVD